MTENISDRLRQSREANGYRHAVRAAEAMGVPAPTYVHHENGTRGIKQKRAKQYASFFRVPLPWLLLGAASGSADPFDGKVVEQAYRETRFANGPDSRREATGDDASIGSATGRRGLLTDGIAQVDPSGGAITFVDEGEPNNHGMTLAAESISDYWRLPYSIISALSLRTTEVIALPVKGSSMLPLLADGDVVFIDTRHRRPSPDGIYALADDFDEIIVKTLRAVDGDDGERWIEIVSTNPEYPVRRRRPSELRIVGRAMRKFSTI